MTTNKNRVDNVVTEYGVPELRGRSIREHARALIEIAYPHFRNEILDRPAFYHAWRPPGNRRDPPLSSTPAPCADVHAARDRADPTRASRPSQQRPGEISALEEPDRPHGAHDLIQAVLECTRVAHCHAQEARRKPHALLNLGGDLR